MKAGKLTSEEYERQLDRLHQFFPRADTKVTALFAISSAQIAVAALNLSANDLKMWWITGPLVVFLLAIAWSMLNLYRCAYPNLEGGHASLIYFSEIAKLRESVYVDKLEAVTEVDWKKDLAGQIWRNSEILKCKYGYLKTATIAATLSLIPWAILLIATSLTHWRVPVIAS
jgi:Family of unknown function (DUF5706)